MQKNQKGFLKLIILIIIALFVLSYVFDISVRSVIDWAINFLKNIF